MTEIADLAPGVASWLEGRGFGCPERIAGGRNNRIFRVRGPSGLAALKVYYRGPEDHRDRFTAERMFYALAAKRGASTASWLDADESLGVALLTWIDGKPVEQSIPEEDVRSAASFLVRVNEPVPADTDVPFVASEACFSSAEHLHLLGQRLSRLEDASEGAPMLGDFLSAQLAPFAVKVRRSLAANEAADFSATAGRRILSPGDFGLHNAMRDQDGRIVFFDFEYSGWDDPVKTVADVFLQPEKPVDWKFLPGFCARLQAWPDLEHRVRAWIPFFAAKWAVILLSPVAKGVAERRRFAGEKVDDAMIERQVSKARRVIERGSEFFG